MNKSAVLQKSTIIPYFVKEVGQYLNFIQWSIKCVQNLEPEPFKETD
jgi:hypothetical protein